MTEGEVLGTPMGVDVVTTASPQPDASRPSGQPLSGRSMWSVGIKTLMESGPVFPISLRGYNQVDVDNYVAWAETELLAARRLTTELIERLTASETERDRARTLLAQSERGRDLHRVSERVTELLRLAAEEADATRHAGVVEAERIVAEATAEADLFKRRAQKLEAEAAARLQDAGRRQAEAAAAVEQARAEAAGLLQHAAGDRQRLDEEAARARAQADAVAAQRRATLDERSRWAREQAEADASARVLAAERQLQTLLAQHEAARQHLSRLADQVGTALRLLGEESAPAFSFDGNQAVPAERTVVPMVSRKTYPLARLARTTAGSA